MHGKGMCVCVCVGGARPEHIQAHMHGNGMLCMGGVDVNTPKLICMVSMCMVRVWREGVQPGTHSHMHGSVNEKYTMMVYLHSSL